MGTSTPHQDGDRGVSVHLYCLHGALQGPDVWKPLADALTSFERPRVRLIAEDLLDAPAAGLDDWADRFCSRIRAAGAGGGRILLGYSLGGRLALHALAACPGLWDGAIVVSAHPGGDDPGAREAIRRRDRRWALRLESEPPARVLRDWDAQPVFGGGPTPAHRPAGSLDGRRWATALRTFSRAEQADLLPRLQAAKLPRLLAVAGADDGPYAAIARRIATAVPAAEVRLVPGAGHRVPWERPEEFTSLVAGFLRGSCSAAPPSADV